MNRRWIWLLVFLIPFRAWSFGAMLVQGGLPPASAPGIHAKTSQTDHPTAAGHGHCHEAANQVAPATGSAATATQADEPPHSGCGNCSVCEVCHGAMLIATAAAPPAHTTVSLVMLPPSAFFSVCHTPGHRPPIA